MARGLQRLPRWPVDMWLSYLTQQSLAVGKAVKTILFTAVESKADCGWSAYPRSSKMRPLVECCYQWGADKGICTTANLVPPLSICDWMMASPGTLTGLLPSSHLSSAPAHQNLEYYQNEFSKVNLSLCSLNSALSGHCSYNRGKFSQTLLVSMVLDVDCVLSNCDIFPRPVLLTVYFRAKGIKSPSGFDISANYDSDNMALWYWGYLPTLFVSCLCF